MKKLFLTFILAFFFLLQVGAFEFQLGAKYSPTQTTFSLWSPDSAQVTLNLDGKNFKLSKIADFDGYTDIYSVTVPGDYKLKRYQFFVNGLSVRDPYGVMVIPGTNTNIVMDLRATRLTKKASTPRSLENRVSSVIYEMHIRDFTLDPNSGVTASKRGTFLGAVESGKKFKGVTTALDHLKELGVTHVQILPFYDYGSPSYNWGYDPVNYNIPEEQYALNPNDYEGRIKELKTMINEFHKNGIRVIMDVVYNHTFQNEMFEGITKKYYDGLNLSGCGNSIDSGNPMVSRFIRDSLEYWVSEFGVDGFRFDLMGIYYVDAVRSWTEYLTKKYPEKNLMFYGEPWNGYAYDPNERAKVRLGNIASMANSHVGVFNSRYREALKGDNDGLGKGFIFAGEANQSLVTGMKASLRYHKNQDHLNDLWDPQFAYAPEQTINYVSAHDNLCLWDKVKYVGEDNDYGKRIVRFAMGMILTSQGIPFIHAGDEFYRTKVYNADWTYAANSYNAPDAYNMIRWETKAENQAAFRYHKDLISFRKNHPALRMTTWEQVQNYVKVKAQGQVLYTEIDGTKIGDSASKIFIVANSGWDTWVKLPQGKWTKVLNFEGAMNQEIQGESAFCEGTGISIFTQKGI